jgi:hypothetical protein
VVTVAFEGDAVFISLGRAAIALSVRTQPRVAESGCSVSGCRAVGSFRRGESRIPSARRNG